MGKHLIIPSSAIEGVHYVLVNGRVFPIVAGGDGPTDDTQSLDALIRLVEQAEGDLSSLSAEFDDDGNLVGGDLFTLRAGLVTGYDETRPSGSTRDELAALQRVQGAIATVDGRVEEVSAEAVTLAGELAALDAAVHGEAEGEGAGEGEGGEADAGGAGDGAGEGGAGSGGDGGGSEGGGEGEGGEQEGGDGGSGGEGEGGGAPQAEGGEQIAAGAGLQPRPVQRPSLSSLRRVQRGESIPQPTGSSSEGRHRVLAYAGLQSIGADSPFANREAIGAELAGLAGAVQVDSPTGRKHYVGKIEAVRSDTSRLVFADDHATVDSEGMIELAVQRNRDLRLAALTVQASGGVCAPPMPDYRIDVVGDRGTPFVETLPTIVSARPLQYFPWMEFDINSAPLAAGIGVVTSAQDLAGYGGLNPFTGATDAIPGGGVKYKDCVHIDCPTPRTCALEAIYKCVTVGRFIAVSFSEYVRVFDEFTGIYFDVARDTRAMSKVLAAAKIITASPAQFGASRDLLARIRQLVAHIRSARHDPDLPVNIYVPEWAKYMVANDIAFSFADGTDNMRITPTQALAVLGSTESIMIETYNIPAGVTTGGSPTVLPLPVNGSPIPEWPNEIRLLAIADGAVFHQQAGQVSFGLQEVGMHTNDYSTFEETLETTCVRGSDIYALDVEVCDNGAAGANVAKVCGGALAASRGAHTNAVRFLDPGDATGGSYTATFDGAPVVVPWNATAAQAETVLTGAPNIDVGDVKVEKVGTRLFIEFKGEWAGQNVPAFVIDNTALTGGAHTATTGTIITGG